MEYSLSSKAFSKILLHAAKYPHRSINGVLLVRKQPEKDAKKVLIVECIPLFHLSLTLAPMMEVALTQVLMWVEGLNQNLPMCKVQCSFKLRRPKHVSLEYHF